MRNGRTVLRFGFGPEATSTVFTVRIIVVLFFVYTHAYCARSDHAGKTVGDHIPVQSQTAANGFHASVNGRVLVVGDRHLGGSVVRHSLFQVVRVPYGR